MKLKSIDCISIVYFHSGLIPRWLLEISSVIITNIIVHLLKSQITGQTELSGLYDYIASVSLKDNLLTNRDIQNILSDRIVEKHRYVHHFFRFDQCTGDSNHLDRRRSRHFRLIGCFHFVLVKLGHHEDHKFQIFHLRLT